VITEISCSTDLPPNNTARFFFFIASVDRAEQHFTIF
jgi:hypothetical protein